VCVVWWAYFDGVNAAGHRHVRCVEDSRRLATWSAAHLPLYLGVALFGIANEHAVRGGGWQALHGQEAVLPLVAVVLIAGALSVLHIEHRRVPSGHSGAAILRARRPNH
jgi:low temperature requirement protein LtrA